MDAKKLIPLATTGVLSLVWLVMTIQKVPVPPMLTQAIVAAVGSLAAGQAVGQAKKEADK